MAQVKIYGVRESLDPIKAELSGIVHGCVVEALRVPADKRFHRFFLMDREDFFFPENRTDRYLILEISLFEGRTVQTKKRLIRLLFQRIGEGLGIAPDDIEITLFETPRHNWGIRGLPGDELELVYSIQV